MSDTEFLQFIYDRFRSTHSQPNPDNIDYMIRFRKIIKSLEESDNQFKFYRIKHKSTGLFFVPSRSVKSQLGGNCRYVKSNLSKKGKIYHHKPQLTLTIGSHIPIIGKYLTESNNIFRTVESDWEIIGFE